MKTTDYVIELHQIAAGAPGRRLERAFRDARFAEIKNICTAVEKC